MLCLSGFELSSRWVPLIWRRKKYYVMAYRQKKFDLSLGQEKRNLFKQASKIFEFRHIVQARNENCYKKGRSFGKIQDGG